MSEVNRGLANRNHDLSLRVNGLEVALKDIRGIHMRCNDGKPMTGAFGWIFEIADKALKQGGEG
jgi:hypothetical protein